LCNYTPPQRRYGDFLKGKVLPISLLETLNYNVAAKQKHPTEKICPQNLID
jgi:hypothetical protein